MTSFLKESSHTLDGKTIIIDIIYPEGNNDLFLSVLKTTQDIDYFFFLCQQHHLRTECLIYDYGEMCVCVCVGVGMYKTKIKGPIL